MPSRLIKFIKVVPPLIVEAFSVEIVPVDLDIVEEEVPGHIIGLEIRAPCVEVGRPKVHPQVLSFVHELHSIMLFSIQMAHLIAINRIRDVVWSPLHLICVPIVINFDPLSVSMILKLVVTVTIDSVRGQRIARERRHDIHVDLVPTTGIETWSIPIGVKGGHCAFLVWLL